MFIYTIGTGNATLDALAADSDASNFQEFFPFLPLRLNNVAVDEGVYATNGLFEETRKAYRKANYFKNIEPGDIDYAGKCVPEVHLQFLGEHDSISEFWFRDHG